MNSNSTCLSFFYVIGYEFKLCLSLSFYMNQNFVSFLLLYCWIWIQILFVSHSFILLDMKPNSIFLSFYIVGYKFKFCFSHSSMVLYLLLSIFLNLLFFDSFIYSIFLSLMVLDLCLLLLLLFEHTPFFFNHIFFLEHIYFLFLPSLMMSLSLNFFLLIIHWIIQNVFMQILVL